MTTEQKNKFRLKYENEFEKKINEMDAKINEVVRIMAKEDEKNFNLFPGWKFFKIKK